MSCPSRFVHTFVFLCGKKGSHTIVPAVNFRRWMYDTCRKVHL